MPAATLHGNKSQDARTRALGEFRSAKTSVLVATDIAARGLDVEDNFHVINFDLTPEPETYVHHIGRTGRAGATGTAVSFCTAEQREDLRAIERLICEPLQCVGDPPENNDPLPAPRRVAPMSTSRSRRPRAGRSPSRVSRRRRPASAPAAS